MTSRWLNPSRFSWQDAGDARGGQTRNERSATEGGDVNINRRKRNDWLWASQNKPCIVNKTCVRAVPALTMGYDKWLWNVFWSETMRESFVYLIALKPIVLNIKHIVTNTNYGTWLLFYLTPFFPLPRRKVNTFSLFCDQYQQKSKKKENHARCFHSHNRASPVGCCSLRKVLTAWLERSGSVLLYPQLLWPSVRHVSITRMTVFSKGLLY